ncbi:MAG: dihydrolipoamide acetyltransferase family protein [Caldilineaceae bacterium]|nr:dihydrolipoamide acetyltransferase family protein [Caldilineaceae bacterium]
MPHEVIMPVLGMNQDTGTLLRWLRREGDAVAVGDPVMEIATDKITVEIESPADGVLAGLSAAEGEEVPVGRAVAWVLEPGESLPADTPAAPAAEPGPVPAGEAGLPGTPARLPAASPVARRLAAELGIDLAEIAGSGGRITKADVERHHAAAQAHEGPVLASPKARRLARERGLELAAISGSGPDGAVLTADVEAFASAARDVPGPPAADAVELEPSRMWQVMASRLTESWQTVPHFYLSRTVDASQMLAWRDALRRQGREDITVSDLLLRITAASLREHPRLNASWRDGHIQQHPQVNIGMAVAVADGLLVPVFHDAGKLSLSELADRRRHLVQAARAGQLTLPEMTGGTFSITNLGMFGVEEFKAIVNPPEAAILAIGAIRDAVVAVQGEPAVRPVFNLTLSCDHRAVDGALAARFLATLHERMETPMLLLD